MAPGRRVWDLSWDEAGNKHTIHTHTLVGTTHLVGFMRGLLPKRKDGSSSATVPFRRRNFSVRSNPARRENLVRSKAAEVIFREQPRPTDYVPVIFRGRPRMSENLRSSTMRAGHEPSKRKRSVEKCIVGLFCFFLKTDLTLHRTLFGEKNRWKNMTVDHWLSLQLV